MTSLGPCATGNKQGVERGRASSELNDPPFPLLLPLPSFLSPSSLQHHLLPTHLDGLKSFEHWTRCSLLLSRTLA